MALEAWSEDTCDEEKSLLCVTCPPSSTVFLLLKRNCCVKVWRIVCIEYAIKFCNIVDNIIICTHVQSVDWETVMKKSEGMYVY